MSMTSERLEQDVVALKFTQAENEKLWYLFCPVAGCLAGISSARLSFLSVAEGDDDGDDVVQETFIVFARRAVRGELECLDGRHIADIANDELDRYVEGCRTYLIHVAKHKCSEFHRKKKTRLRVIGRRIDNVLEQDGDPAADLLRREQADDVQRAITRLPERLYEVLLLRFFAQCSEKEIAAYLNISVRMVKYRLHELLEQLRIMLSSETVHNDHAADDHAADGNGARLA